MKYFHSLPQLLKDLIYIIYTQKKANFKLSIKIKQIILIHIPKAPFNWLWNIYICTSAPTKEVSGMLGLLKTSKRIVKPHSWTLCHIHLLRQIKALTKEKR